MSAKLKAMAAEIEENLGYRKSQISNSSNSHKAIPAKLSKVTTAKLTLSFLMIETAVLSPSSSRKVIAASLTWIVRFYRFMQKA